MLLLSSVLHLALAAPLAPAGLDRATTIDPVALHDALLARFDNARQNGGCLTGLVRDLEDNWDLFSPDERARMTAFLAPFKDDLLDDLPDLAAGMDVANAPPPPSGAPTSTCFGSQGDTQLSGTHFQVQWDSGTVSQQVAQDFLDSLEYAWTAEVEEHGWNDFDGDGQYLMLAYIENQNTGGAYTTVSTCGNIYAPYIVAGKDAVNYGTWTQEMAAHEFNHSLQFSYSFAPEFWWWEATATYVQSLVRDSTNWSSYIAGYSDKPYIAMGAYSQTDQDVFWHMYGLSIFGHYLDEYQGGEAAVRGTWENSEGSRGQYTLTGKDMVEGLGLDWLDTYTDFITKNVAMDYDQHRLYGSIDVTDHAGSFPASGAGDGKSRPQGYGQNYIRFDGGGGSGDLQVTFSGDTSVDWVLVLASTDGSTVLDSVSTVASGGVGTLTFPGYGDDDVYLVVSPLTDGDDKYDYSWEAELVSDGGDTAALDTGGGPADDAGGPKAGGEVAGCGCASAPGTGGGLLALGLAVAALRRR